jgi:hypothetical protein
MEKGKALAEFRAAKQAASAAHQPVSLASEEGDSDSDHSLGSQDPVQQPVRERLPGQECNVPLHACPTDLPEADQLTRGSKLELNMVRFASTRNGISRADKVTLANQAGPPIGCLMHRDEWVHITDSTMDCGKNNGGKKCGNVYVHDPTHAVDVQQAHLYVQDT